MSQYKTNCEYCGEGFSRRYYAEKDKANHKRKCSQKRYLGGTLIIEHNKKATDK